MDHRLNVDDAVPIGDAVAFTILRAWFLSLHRADRLAIAAGIIMVVAFTALTSAGWTSRGIWVLLPRFGFGPEWTCSWVAGGEPVCVKDVKPPPVSQSAH